MAFRSPKHPLDVSTRYPESVIADLPIVRARDRISGLAVHPDTDDLTNEVLYQLVRKVWGNSHKTLAYCDVIDLTLEAVADSQRSAEERVAKLEVDVASLKTSIDALISFLAIAVPAWINRNEVENGDDMGIIRPSAAALGIPVVFEFVREQPGLEHEDVVSISPPAGALIARGSTVTITLNLLG